MHYFHVLTGSDSPPHERHAQAVEALAQQTGIAASVIERLYEAELAKLEAGATITDFLLVLVCRRVREQLASRRPRPRA